MTDWLAVLNDGWARGLIPPAGLVWEKPRELPIGGHPGPRNRGSWGSRVPRQGVVPVTPPEVAEAVAEFLRRHPGRWARVWDCTTTDNTAAKRPLRRRGLDVTIRTLGTTVAVYAYAKPAPPDMDRR